MNEEHETSKPKSIGEALGDVVSKVGQGLGKVADKTGKKLDPSPIKEKIKSIPHMFDGVV